MQSAAAGSGSLTHFLSEICNITLWATHSTSLKCRTVLCSQFLGVLFMLTALGDLSKLLGALCMLSCNGRLLMCSLLQSTFLHKSPSHLVERHLCIVRLAPKQAGSACYILQLRFCCLGLKQELGILQLCAMWFLEQMCVYAVAGRWWMWHKQRSVSS